MRKIVILFLILILAQISFAKVTKVNFEFSKYDEVIRKLMKVFQNINFEEKSPIVSKLQFLLAHDPLTYFGKFTGLFDINTQEAVKNLQDAFGFTTYGFLNQETVKNLFPRCRIEVTSPAEEEVLLGAPTMISWQFDCLPFLGKFVNNDFLVRYRILRMKYINIYLTQNCPQSNIWWYPGKFPDCSYRLISKLPLINQNFIWTPTNLPEGVYTIRLVPVDFQTFQRDLGLIPSGWARLFAESEPFKIVAPKEEAPSPVEEIELPSL